MECGLKLTQGRVTRRQYTQRRTLKVRKEDNEDHAKSVTQAAIHTKTLKTNNIIRCQTEFYRVNLYCIIFLRRSDFAVNFTLSPVLLLWSLSGFFDYIL